MITGGAGLLGREFAKTLLEFGGKVVLVDILEAKGKEALKEIAWPVPENLKFVSVDITDPGSVEKMVSLVKQSFAKIDILVNAAAINPKFEKGKENQHGESFEDYPLEKWNQALAVNLTGAFLCCQKIGKVMLKQGGGVIINIGSELGLLAPDQRIYLQKKNPAVRKTKPIDYPVTKAGLIHLTKYLASYWGDKNIRVNCLCPANVKTTQDPELEENIAYRTILGRMSRKDEFGGALIFLASSASSYLTGGNLVVDGGKSVW